MIKRNGFAILLSIVMLLSILTACAKDDSSGKNGETDAAATKAPAGAETPAGTEAPASALTGNINISLMGASSSVWNAVADAYMEKNPNVKVKVDNKPADGYKEWLTAQFAAGDPDVDIVQNNEVGGLMNDGKFTNYYPYFDKMNNYTGKPW
ncbi:MAG: carbohydrate transporter substrate-binding protein, partial [Paenibacillus sp.]|nr:carbohydrate transporter substrate-binding protein [Paenibacillus sp.]